MLVLVKAMLLSLDISNNNKHLFYYHNRDDPHLFQKTPHHLKHIQFEGYNFHKFPYYICLYPELLLNLYVQMECEKDQDNFHNKLPNWHLLDDRLKDQVFQLMSQISM